MAGNPRDTRCISAAFDFLSTTDFCQRCAPGDEGHGLDYDSDLTDSSCDLGVKKSESDTALLHCQEDNNNGREERRLVCLCPDRDESHDQRHGGQRGGDFLQGYIDRYAPERREDGRDMEGCSSGKRDGESGRCFIMRKGEEKMGSFFTGQTAWEERSQCVQGGSGNGDVNSCSPPGRTGEKGAGFPHVAADSEPRVCLSDLRDPDPTVNGQGQITSDCENMNHSGTQEMDTKSEILDNSECGMGSTDSMKCEDPVSSADAGRLSVKGESCKGSSVPKHKCIITVHVAPPAHTGKKEEEEEEEEEVIMRPNRHTLNRRSTDTALVSSAFGFLPSTDSVFLPSDKGSCCSTGPNTTKTRCTRTLMLSVDEHESHLCDHEHRGECRAAEVGEGDSGFSSITDSVGTKAEQSTTRDDAAAANNGETGPGDQGTSKDRVECATSEEDGAAIRLRRRHLSKQGSIVEEEEGSGDSSDEDAGVYAESFRRSNWIRIDDDGQVELAFPAVNESRLSSASRSSAASRSSGASRSSSWSTDMTDCSRTPSPKVASEERPQKSPSPRLYISHKRSDSTSTTLSEKEFKKEYVSRRKCLIKRQNSSKEYHRFSSSVYEEEKTVTLEKGSGEVDFGLHILDSQPAYITGVDPGSAADRAGVEEGQILVSINGTNVLSSSHDDIVTLIINSPSVIQVAVATSDFQPSRDLQAALMEGHMQKLGGSSPVIMRRWKKRFFVLRQDSCLYYYKHKDDSDPLGAIPLAGYTFSRHLDTGRDYCFKAEKYGARTYYFMTDSRDTMTEWVGALSEAAARSKNRKDSFVSVSSHNVGLPALDIRRPECTGYLLKVGNRRKTWHRRYCVLKDACLYYYKNMNSLSALGVAHLHGYKVDASVAVGKKHAFALMPPVESLRVFQFSAENDTDRQRWVQAMIRSIQRWIQIDHDR
ncbi:uncharacterized protein LOC143290924 [Babylonia areolata]|uniref:uncharacterized protein LOC143290924 n=1 Tax=Babylonia areolata TaxID=304850 RepID=UPI003FCF97DC